MKNEKSSSSGVTFRAVCIGLALIPINSYFSIQTPTPTTTSLIYTSILQLCLLAGINAILVAYMPKFSFSSGELLTIYAMLNIAASLAGHDIMQVLGPIPAHAFWFATPENDWKELFWRYLPSWLTVSDRKIVRGHYEGGSTLNIYSVDNLKAWVVPALWWSAFLFALGMAMLCFNLLIRRQWVEEEKLSYPIIRLPLEIISESERAKKFWKNRLLWVGFALAGGIDLVNGLNAVLPIIPGIPTRSVEIGRFFTEKPLSAMGWTPVCFFPFVIGLSFFMPLDLSFSCWFFYWVWKAQMVMGSALGLRSMPEFPYIKSQALGAYCALGLIALYHIRRPLSLIFKKAVLGVKEDKKDDLRQILSYRLATFGLIIGVAFLVGFSIKAGMAWWVVIPFFALYFALSLTITRIRAELGPPVNEFYNMGPDQMLPKMFGVRRLGAQTMTVFALYWGFNRSNRCHLMPHQLEAFKMAEQFKIRPYKLAWAMFLAILVGSLSAFWAYLHLRYTGEGFGGGFGWEAFNNLQRWLYYQTPADKPAVFFMGFGFSATSFLTMLRWRFIWWPLHPIGYILAESVNWSMSWMWSSIFVSWCLKAILLKHGGIKAYRKSVPLFLGLILGDYLMGGVWNIYDVLTHRHTYTFWH